MKNKEQLKEDYPVGALVRCVYLRARLRGHSRAHRLYGIIIDHVSFGSCIDLLVYTSEGESKLFPNCDWKVIAKA